VPIGRFDATPVRVHQETLRPPKPSARVERGSPGYPARARPSPSERPDLPCRRAGGAGLASGVAVVSRPAARPSLDTGHRTGGRQGGDGGWFTARPGDGGMRRQARISRGLPVRRWGGRVAAPFASCLHQGV